MLSILKSRKILSWCFFDFGISSYPTLILTFFYGAFYAKMIASTPELGTSNWGFAISSASVLSFLVFSIILIQGRQLFRVLSNKFFLYSFYILILSSFSLFFFGQGSNAYLPLILVSISLISFEIINLFYNISLHRVVEKKKEGLVSNLGWAFGYLGGLISLAIILVLINLSERQDFLIMGMNVFLLIGPFVAFWTFLFGMFHMRNFKDVEFKIPNLLNFFKNIGNLKIYSFFISYFFFNNAVICIFAFASMFASFLFSFSEKELLFLGIFINLFGILGCLVLGRVEDKIGSEKNVRTCILALLILTTILFFLKSKMFFWLLSLGIGFFIGPIQASSRSVLVKRIKYEDQVSAFCIFSIFGNMCAILGPLLVSLVIEITGSIRLGLTIIPMFFLISLVPFFLKKINA